MNKQSLRVDTLKELSILQEKIPTFIHTFYCLIPKIPQISRKYSRIVIVGILIVLVIFSFITFSPNTQLLREFNQTRVDLVKDPSNPLLHIKMARIFKQANDLEKAKTEYLLALGKTHEKTQIQQALIEIKGLQEQPDKIREQISFWEKVSQEKPGYRDAYFQLAVLHWQLYDNQPARDSLNKALELDPNFEAGKELGKILDAKN